MNSQFNKQETQNLAPVSEIDIFPLLARAQHYDFCRQIDKGVELLKPVWNDFGSRPLVDNYSPPVAAEILLRCGSLLSYISHFKQLPYQDMARNWLTESAEIFTQVENPDKVAEAETDLGMAYWREGRFEEALIWLQTAAARITNPINSVSIKNISYQLLALNSINTAESIQAGINLVKEKDIYAELTNDSRVKVHYYNNSAVMMSRIGNLPDALDRHLITRQYCKEVGNLLGEALAENNIGYIYKELRQYKKAVYHANIGLDSFVKQEIIARQGDCLDTLAQIYLEMGELPTALKYIDRSIELLSPFGVGISSPRAQVDIGDYPSLINSLHTKARILLRQNRVDGALLIFCEYTELAKEHISQLCADRYAAAFAKLIFAKTGAALPDENSAYEKELIRTALTETDGTLPSAAEKLSITADELRNIMVSRHPDLLKKFDIKKGGNHSVGKLRASLLKAKNFKPPPPAAFAEINLVEVECNGKRAFIPSDVELRCYISITEPILPNIGLIEGRIAVVSRLYPEPSDFPTVLQVFLTSEIHYGFRRDACGLIGLESENASIHPPKAFAPDTVEILGVIIGYFEYNFELEYYEFHSFERSAS